MSVFYLICTGANRGIGLAITKRLATANTHVIAVGRRSSDELEAACSEAKAKLTFVKLDMSETETLSKAFTEQALGAMNEADAERVVFVQNAGVAFTAPCGTQDADEVRRSMLINAVAPQLLTEAFVRHVQAWSCRKQLLGISSGAARRPIDGWATYCASKAALEMSLKVLHSEQAAGGHAHPIAVCSYGPGVVMTDMQVRARESTLDLPIINRLKEMYEKGEGFSPETCANMVHDFLESEEFGKEPTADAYELAKKD